MATALLLQCNSKNLIAKLGQKLSKAGGLVPRLVMTGGGGGGEGQGPWGKAWCLGGKSGVVARAKHVGMLQTHME